MRGDIARAGLRALVVGVTAGTALLQSAVAIETGAAGLRAQRRPALVIDAVVAFIQTLPPISNKVERTDFQKKAFP